eukprot:CAMPEP_0119195394 /NCGR_PEP_ID=MMETSP1316-20130426/5867_1 /TAXON_ID=41880 /ORGANISM="Pycnococcus provasolii, Strain RCC2336" /LENGTH=46 /DNA_ID= /DNA_START= /DNA_END= /DNA_ORIENTATION=
MSYVERLRTCVASSKELMAVAQVAGDHLAERAIIWVSRRKNADDRL